MTVVLAILLLAKVDFPHSLIKTCIEPNIHRKALKNIGHTITIHGTFSMLEGV